MPLLQVPDLICSWCCCSSLTHTSCKSFAVMETRHLLIDALLLTWCCAVPCCAVLCCTS